MNKHEPQSRQPADQQTLPEAIEGDLSQLPSEVIDIGDAPPIAPRAAADAERSPHHPDEPDADDVSGRARPDHRRHRAADHRPAIPGCLQPVMGDYRLSAGFDRGGAGVRHAQRHLRPPRHDHRRAQPVHRGLDAVRAGAEHAGADPGARPAGARRRRHHADRADGDFGRGDAARARPVSGLFQRRMGGSRNRRTDPRRRVCRASALVDDLLDQRAARAGIAGAAAAEDGQDSGVSPQAQGRLARRRAADGLRGGVHAGADLGRQPLSLAVADHHGDGRCVRRADASPSYGMPEMPKSRSCRCR